MKIYISGPITGKPNLNREAFAQAAEAIRAAGHEAVNPHEITAPLGDDAPWEEYMKIDIAALVTCDAILLLEGWQGSKGARLENKIARKLKIARLDSPECVKAVQAGAQPSLTLRCALPPVDDVFAEWFRKHDALAPPCDFDPEDSKCVKCPQD